MGTHDCVIFESFRISIITMLGVGLLLLGVSAADMVTPIVTILLTLAGWAYGASTYIDPKVIMIGTGAIFIVVVAAYGLRSETFRTIHEVGKMPLTATTEAIALGPGRPHNCAHNFQQEE